MIDVWLKIRKRDNEVRDFVLKHLEYWLGVFGDSNKFRIWLYNENFPLGPEYSTHYTVLNKQKLLESPYCKKLDLKVARSRVSNCWKAAAFALSAPYFYLQD